MKKIILSLFACMLLSAPAAEAAQYGIYLAPKIGASLQDMSESSVSGAASSGLSGDREASLSGGIAIGYDLQYSASALPVRVEFEAIFRSSSTANNRWSANGATYSAEQTARMDTYFVNAYYDFYNSTPFIPYVGAGVGAASVSQEFKINGQSVEQDETVAAFNAGFGVAWLIKGGFTADFGYKYIYPGEVKSSVAGFSSTAQPQGHEVLFGLRYTF